MFGAYESPFIPLQVNLAAPGFDEDKLLIYRELYYDGFSSIIAARDLTSGASVSVKKVEFSFMKPSPIPINQLHEKYSQKIRQQVARMRALSHNSLLRLTEYNIEPTRVVLVTEMCMFGDLFNWMLQQPHLRVRDLCQVMQYVFQALHYMHLHDCVHGNLTPTHILFQSTSPQSVTIMPDLSVRSELVWLTGRPPCILDHWAPESLRAFMSPQLEHLEPEVQLDETLPVSGEIERKGRPISPASDVWSAGVALHIALTGKPPFSASNVTEFLNTFADNTSSLDNPMLKTVSPLVKHSIQQFISIDPEQRAKAETGAESSWFDDDTTRNDNRNILSIIEFDLMSTCRRYRSEGRLMFEQVFNGTSVVDY